MPTKKAIIQVYVEPELKEYIMARAKETDPPISASAYILLKSQLRSEFRRWKAQQRTENFSD